MATKKSVSAAKRPVKKSAATAAKSTTKTTVTKVTSVKSAASSARAGATKFRFSRSPILAASVAEFIGAFALAGIVLATQGASIYVLFALVGLVLMVGAISGAHFNPAITVGAWATRRVNSARALAYIVAQVLGALLAFVILNSYMAASNDASGQASQLGAQSASLFSLSALPEGKEGLVLAAELLGAALFGFGFATATRERSRNAAAWTIAGSLFVALTVSGYLTLAITSASSQLTGAAPLSTVLNPAVAGALQAISFSWWPILVYIVAPVIGAVLGFKLRDMLVQEAEA